MNKPENKPKIALINLGCSKNLVDSEVMLGLLDNAGFDVSLDEANAAIILINTCSFIQDAEKESVRVIMEQVADKQDKKIIIVGCLAQKYGRELIDLIPEVSAVVGTSDIGNIVRIVEELYNDYNKHLIEVSSEINYLQHQDDKRYHITVGPYSYIKISEGCDWRCTYCLIPMLKGRYRSRTIESIVKEATVLAKNGTAEIVLIAQDTTNYGYDLYDRLALVELLEKLEKITELKWIRLMYTYPKNITDELIDFIAVSKKVVNYLDIPLQHIHPAILRAMSRPEVDIESLLAKLRTKIAGLAIRTSFIVGFPGETEEQFESLFHFVKEQKFERLGVFEYSKEKKTPAAKLPGQVKARDKKRRRKMIMQLQNQISLENHQKFSGAVLDVLLEKITGSGNGVGRSYLDAPEIDGLVYINSVASSDYLPGDVIPVKITKVSPYDMYGIVEN